MKTWSSFGDSPSGARAERRASALSWNFGCALILAGLHGAAVTTLCEESSTTSRLPLWGVPGLREVHADFESLWASDILLTQSTLGYGQTRRSTEYQASFAHSSMDFDYRPVSFDFLGQPTEVGHDRFSLQGNVRSRLGERWTVLGSLGWYDGYTDYRSAWLDEYYRQQFSTLPDYVAADPKGWNLSTGLRWEYLPASGFLQIDLTYLRDDIAPGYEIDFDGLFRGRETLHTYGVSFTAENVLTPRLRLLNELHILDTTERDVRYTYQASLNVALGERWVWRNYAGVTLEDPNFEAYFAGSTLEYEATSSWLIGLNGRYYTDTGEIENSLLFSAAAPGVRSYQLGLSSRWFWGQSVLKVFAAPYFTRYEQTGLGTAFFENLYRDRDWGMVQVAYSLNF